MTPSLDPPDRRLAVALVAWALGLGVTLCLDDPRLRYLPFLAGWAVACAGWWLAVEAARTGLLSRRAVRAAVVAGLVARALALASPPAFSEDVFRYVYEGRVAWREGPGFPFAVAPAEAPTAGVDPALLDAAWLRINHAELSTIYPPLAQLVFALAGGLGEVLGGGHLLALKGALVLADLLAWALMARLGGALALAWGLCPLVVLEVAREGHGDALAAAGLALAIAGFGRDRPRAGYLGLSLAALAKLTGLLVLPVALRHTRRGAWIAAASLPLLALPWLLAGPGAGEGLGAYASRWRAGDGAFGLLLALARALLGGAWARVLGWTITADALARALAGLAFAAAVAATLRRPGPVASIPARAGLCLLVFLLVAPTLHPWYVLWVLPFAALPGFPAARPVMLLATLAALLHHPGWLELTTGAWTDLAWVRALVHVPVIAALLAALARARGLAGPAGLG